MYSCLHEKYIRVLWLKYSIEYYDCIGVLETLPVGYILYTDYVAMGLYDTLSLLVRSLHHDQKSSYNKIYHMVK